ncbi:hypothetical protein GCM10010466_10120 [Planomonospora alba]|uniref:Uncharacterized protein n=1 Tax=Planomonospora alba TaxID=161354 RepID=A0ABP6MQP9_9ACTN
MPRLEDELRAAMAAETAGLGAAPDLADRVVRLSRRRRRRLLTAGTALVAAVLAAGTVIPGQLIGAQRDPVAAAEQPARADADLNAVEDVEARYLPAGLGAPLAGSGSAGKLDVATLSWGSGDGLVRLSKYKKALPAGPGRITSLGLIPGGKAASIRGRPGLVSPDGLDLLWHERDDVVLRVTVGADHRDELTRIAEGLWFPDPTGSGGGTLEGVRIADLPDGVYLDREVPASSTEPVTRKEWSGQGGRVRLSVVRGENAADLDALRTWLERTDGFEAVRSREAVLRTAPAWEGTTGEKGWGGRPRAVLWHDRPGLGFLLEVAPGMEKALDEIIAGLGRDPEPDDRLCEAPAAGKAADVLPGVIVPRIPERLTAGAGFTDLESLSEPEKVTVRGHGWSDERSVEEGGSALSVGVVCGVATERELRALVGHARRAAPVRGRPAVEWVNELYGGGRFVMWLERPGAAIFVGATPDLEAEAGRIAEEIRRER